MLLVKILLITSLLSLITGQLIRFGFSQAQGALTLTDIFVMTSSIVFLMQSLLTRSLRLQMSLFLPFVLFSLAASASTVLAATKLEGAQILLSSLFLVRFISYFLISAIVFNVVKKDQVLGWVHIILVSGAIFSLIGLFQFFIFPDLSAFALYGWDPHQSRIFSSVLDPNYSGGLFSIFFSLSLSLFLYKKKLIYLALSILFFSVLILTFSRSSYLSFLTVLAIVGALKSKRTLAVALFIFIMVTLVVGQAKDRIIGAFTLDETSVARVESWQRAITILKDNILFGVGFNTYRFVQADYGFFNVNEPQGGHSGSGTDSSLLLVAVTSGVFGFAFFLWLIFATFKVFLKKHQDNFLKLAGLSSLCALVVHSQFVNSFFFPQIMLIFWFVVGLSLVYDS